MKKPPGSASCPSHAQASMSGNLETTGAAWATMPLARTSRGLQTAPFTRERMQRLPQGYRRQVSCAGYYALTDSIQRSHPPAQNPDTWWQCSGYDHSPHFRQMKGIKRHQVICPCQILCRRRLSRRACSRALGLRHQIQFRGFRLTKVQWFP